MRPSKTLIEKLGMPKKKQSSPPALIMATIIARVIISTLVEVTTIINARSLPIIPTQIIASTKPKRKASSNQKVKGLVYILFPTLLPPPTTKFTFPSLHLLNLKLVKIPYYITLFFFVDIDISYFLILVPKSLFFPLILFFVIICLHFLPKSTI